jgi:chorismate mutase
MIDEVDEQIMGLLARRMKISADIGRLKKRNNIAILQPERWQKVLQDRMESAKAKGLAEPFVVQLYQRIHEESILFQELAELD